MVLHRKEIVNKISKDTGLKKQDIKLMLTALKEIIYEELVHGNSISMRNLFTLTPTIRTGNKYNISSREVEYRDEYVSVRAIPSKAMRDYVRSNSKLTKRDKQLVYQKQMAALEAKMKMLEEE